MTRRKKIIYWISTVWLALGMISTGVVQIIQMDEEVTKMSGLGYPSYFLPIIGTWKLLGSLVVLLPKRPLIKEWAYAGFFFLMSGAIISHLVVGDKAAEFFGPVLLLLLTIISWTFRPNEKKLVASIP